jgi:hypothetical protein
MGWARKAQSIQVQIPTKSPFSNVDLVWVKGKHHKGSKWKSIDVAYIPYACVQDFLEGKWGNLCTLVEWNIHRNMHAQKDIKNPTIWHWTLGILGMYQMKVLPSFAYYLLKLLYTKLECSLCWINWMQCKKECGYGLEDHCGDLDHTISIKHGCLAPFLVKWLYVRLEVVEISFYHHAHICTKNEPTHGQDDLEFATWMSLYVP